MRTRTGWTGLARPVLRSGLHVVRRDDAHLQVGLDEPDRLVLRDQPGLYEALTALERPPSADLRPVLDRLVADGWVVDAAEPSRRARERTERRPAVTLEADALLRAPVTRVCAAAGLRVAEQASAATLVVTLGEPRRRVSDRLVRDDVPHLWLAVLPTSVRIGPFVEPGRTACLRCVDARLGERDARRATVLHQLDELPVAPYAELGTVPARPRRRLGGPRHRPAARRRAACPAVGDRDRQLRARGHAARLAAPPPLRLRVGLIVGPAHHHSLSSFPSMARRCSREQVSQ